MKKEIYFCDICNKELDDKRDDCGKQKYAIKKKGGYDSLIEPELDICSSCYERLVKFINAKN